MLADIAGPVRSILALERTALNFLQRLSGIATLTARFVQAVEGTSAEIYDTRKTTPGWRVLEKYAVRCGGGRNHRMGLHDAMLIKDNHLAWLRTRGGANPIPSAIAAARRTLRIRPSSRSRLIRSSSSSVALRCGPDVILVDNLGPEALIEAVTRRNAVAADIKLEASGGVRLETVRDLARTGVDRISVGALTHSAPALDIALDIEMPPE